MGNFFRYDSKVMHLITKAAETIWIGILFVLCSIPIFTIGAASCGLYYAYNKSVRQKKGYPATEFFSAFKSNFKKSTVATLILLVVGYILAMAVYTCFYIKDAYPFIGLSFIALVIVSILIVMWMAYLFPYLSRFNDTLGHAAKCCVLIMIANPIWTILLFLMLIIAILGFVVLTFMSGILGLFMPALYVMVANLILEKVFRKYMAPEDAKLQKDYDNELA